MAIKMLEMLFFIICASIEGTFASNYTRAEAELECRGNSGLASYRHFVGDKGTILDKAYDLKEGESAWISGYVNFSKFVAYHGCYSVRRDSVHKYTLQENNIYNCLQDCSRIENITYIGLLNKVCYCANITDMAYFNAKPDKDCNPELIYSNIESSSSVQKKEGNISIYRIINNKILFWVPPFSEACGQCVKVWSDGKATQYQTISCYYKADSFICTKSAYHHSLYGQCGLQKSNFCIISESNSLMKSFKACLKYEGKLFYFVSTRIKGNLTANKSYWTGIFRTFKIENKSVFPGNNVCLSVKNVNGNIVFDPADCSTEKIFICEEEFFKKTKSTSTRTSVDTNTISATASIFVTTTIVENTTITTATELLSSTTLSPTSTNIGDNKTDLVGVYIAVAVVVTVALSIIVTCFIFRKRKQLQATSTHKRGNSKDHDNNMSDNSIRASISNVAERQEPAYQSVEDEVTYAKPDTALKKIPSPDGEYDRIRVKGLGERKENTSKTETIDNHVYGFHSAHPIDIDIEVYDHVEASRKNNFSKPTDGIYNTFAEDSDTYNVLRPGNKEESFSRSAFNRTKIKETCPTYDTNCSDL